MTPMFCENEENGVVDIMAAKADPKPVSYTHLSHIGPHEHSKIGRFHFRDAGTLGQNRHREYQNVRQVVCSSSLNIQCANLDGPHPMVMARLVRFLSTFSKARNPLGFS